jgi:N-glycosylase/DNA lyase
MKTKKDLIFEVKKLLNSDIKTIIDEIIVEFEDLSKKDDKSLFLEMCFCILTANFQAERGIIIHEKNLDIDFQIQEQVIYL